MKRFIFALVLCLAAALLITGCQDTSPENNTKSDAVDSSRENSAEGEAFDSPADLEMFSSLEEFTAQAFSAGADETQANVASLASLGSFYLPVGLPEGYELYKITAGAADIAFWYLPEEDLASRSTIGLAESSQKHFMFISSRGYYDFNSMQEQFGVSDDELIDNNYMTPSISGNLITWQVNGDVLMMYTPVGYEYTDLQSLCAVEKYVRNESTQSFLAEDVTE